MRRALRAMFAVGVRGAASPLIGLELIVAVALGVSLAFPAPPPPVPAEVTFLCRRSAVHCWELEAGARTEAIEALETP